MDSRRLRSSRCRDRFQCGEGVYPDNHAQRTIEILLLPFFLASLVLRSIVCVSEYYSDLSGRDEIL